MTRSRMLVLAAVAAAMLAHACGDGSTEPTPDPRHPTTVSVTPANAELTALGATVRLSGEVRDQNGTVMANATVSWSSSDVSVAAVDGSGLVSAAGNGAATITAAAGGASGRASVAVAQVVSAVTVSAAADFVVEGDTLRLSADAADANGHAVGGAEFEWATSDTLVAAVDGSGLVTGVGLGEVELTATSSGVEGSAKLTVVGPVPTTMTLSPNAVRFTALGDTEQPSAEVRDQIGRVMEGVAVTWSSSDMAVAAVDSAGLVTAAGNGAATITAAAGNASATLAVTVMQSVDFVGVTPVATTLLRGDTLRLLAEALDRNGHPVDGNTFTWETSDAAVARVDDAGLVEGVSDGKATVSAETGGVTGTSEITVTTRDPVQVAALEALYHSTTGQNWYSNEGWLTDAPLDEWYGVGVDDAGRVTALNLRWNNLAGEIPPEVGNLSSLAVLNLPRNRLAGPVPPNIVRLQQMVGFFISENEDLCVPGTSGFASWLQGIEEHDAQEATSCGADDAATLKLLYDATGGAGWTRSEGWLGEGFLEEWHGVNSDSLGRVVALDLEGNGLAGELGSDLGALTRMTRLRIGSNDLAGRLPQSLAWLSLREFHYADTQLCAPNDELFQAWLNGIASHEGTGVECAPLSDREILEVFHEATGGPDWRSDRNWLTDAPLDRWGGVDADDQGRVVELDLGWNNLVGVIPPELGGLANLTGLHLDDNELRGPIPPELGDLASLTGLHLDDNELSGPIPPELGNLTSLERLRLDSNNLTGSIPPELGNLTSLALLRLDRNGLTGSIPLESGNLRSLQWLDLGYNDLTGPIPSELGNLAGLEEMRLSDNKLTGPLPPQLGQLAALTRFDARNNDFTGPVPPEFGAMSSLRTLDLKNNQSMAGPLPAALTGLGELSYLYAADTGLCAPASTSFRAWLSDLRRYEIDICLVPVLLIQATQSREQPVPLVAGKKALLRVFVTAALSTSAGIPPVVARFYRDGQEIHGEEIPGKSTPIPTRVDEGSLAKSANAEIPGHVVQPGLEVVVEVDPNRTLDPALGVPARIPETGRLHVEVVNVPFFDLTLVPLVQNVNPDSSIVDLVEAIAADPEGHALLSDTRTLLPVAEIDVTGHEPVVTSTVEPLGLLRRIRAIRTMEGGTGHYMGMIPRSLADRIAGIATVRGWSSMAIPDSSTMAHELGHNMNLEHAPCGGPDDLDYNYPHLRGGIGVWGYDFHGDGRLVDPSTPDVMTYCDPTWISDYHFTKAMDYRVEYQSTASVQSPAASRRSLLVWGGTSQGGVPFLEPAFVVDAPPALPSSGGSHRVVGRAAGGAELFSLAFDMPELADGDGSSAFAFAVPVQPAWAASLASITLSGPGGSFTLDGDSDLAMAILRDARTGQVRAILRDQPGAALASTEAATLAERTPGLRVLYSRGIPGPEAWDR